MTFLNASLLFGAVAAAIPIVLHLLARREPRKVVFPSVRFLVHKFESNRSRLRVRRWWLLALRIAALVMLAAALARPAIHQSLSITWLTIGLVVALAMALFVMATVAVSRGLSRAVVVGLAAAAGLILLGAGVWGALTYASGPRPSLDSLEPVAIAIVLDNSPTSAWHSPDDDRISRMKEVATWMVSQLPRTSRIAIVDRSAQVASFSLDASSAVAKIEQLQPAEVTQPIAARLEAAARLVRTSDLPNRQVLLVTDLSKSTWSTDDAQTNRSLAEASVADQPSMAAIFSEDPAVSLTVFDLGEFVGMNRALSIPQLADRTPPQDTPVAITTNLSLSSPENDFSASVTAELEVYDNDPALPVIRDGVVVRPSVRSVDRASVRISAGGSSQLLLTIPTLSTGTHHGRIRLVGDDAMPLDDTRYFSLQVLPPSHILIVGDDADDAGVIAQAIEASAGMMDESKSEYIVERVGSDDLTAVQLNDFEVIVLLDPPALALQDESIARFVSQGRGVLVCLGPSAGEQSTESSFAPKLVRRWRVPEPGTFFQVSPTKHRVTEQIASNTPWSSFRVQQYWQLQTEPADQILIQFAGTTHPAVVERTSAVEGAGLPGRVLVVATPLPALSSATRSWNKLFGSDPWPAWLLCRQAIEYLARRGDDDLTPMVGQLLSLPMTPESSDSGNRRVQLFPPGDSPPIPLEVAPDVARVTINDIHRSGTWWLRGPQDASGFSANLAEDATDLTRIAPEQLDVIFGPEQYNLARTFEEIQFAQDRASQRVSLHSPAILLAMMLFALEQILANRFYRINRKPSAAMR
jgi:hypothetical protein